MDWFPICLCSAFMKHANGHFQGTILQVSVKVNISVVCRIRSQSPFVHVLINRDDHKEHWNCFCAKTFVPLYWFIPVQLCWLGELSSHVAMMNNLVFGMCVFGLVLHCWRQKLINCIVFDESCQVAEQDPSHTWIWSVWPELYVIYIFPFRTGTQRAICKTTSC